MESFFVPFVGLICLYFAAKWENEICSLLIKYLKFYLKKMEEKKDFMTSMSNGLKRPLNTILGLLDLLAKEIKSVPMCDFIESAQNNGEVLLNLINNILETSKLS